MVPANACLFVKSVEGISVLRANTILLLNSWLL